MKKFLAFTLAETLIVMGIIGIVSALTLPNLNSSTGEKEKVAKVKKIHQNLEDAIGRAVAVYGPMDEWIVNDTTASAQATRFGDRITEFMKVSKNCSLLTSKPCFSNGQSPKLGYGVDIDGGSDVYKFILADGTSMAIQYEKEYSSANDVWFFFDIDGPNKGQSYLGADLFAFHYNLPSATLFSTNDNTEPQLSAITTGRGEDATAWVVRYDNMDYLKVDSSGKCKNNTSRTLNATANPPVTTCK